MEVLARWQRKGIRVSAAVTPAAPPPELAARMSVRQIEEYTESAQSMFIEYTPRMVALAAAEPRLAYLLPLFAAIAEDTNPGLPAMEESLLRGPLRAHITCGMPGCRLPHAVGGGRLLICKGGCGGLTRYCSREHQHAHWKQHRGFCKRAVAVDVD